ncbi:MAG: diphthine synthase [Methanocellales archaeon]
MLTFIGLGLYDEKDITLKGLEAIRNANVVYAEFYTSRLLGTTLEKMEQLYGKKITLLKREDIEYNPQQILENARTKNVALLCGGDPLIATTHLDLRLRAFNLGIEIEIIHNASIQTAVCGLTGLINYRFGKSATVAFPYRDRVFEAPYDAIKLNLASNLHTLLFLDIQDDRFMTISEALDILMQIERQRNEKILQNRLMVGVARAGSKKPLVKANYIEHLLEYDFGPPLHILVAPTDLHFMEAEALIKFANAPKEILKKA